MKSKIKALAVLSLAAMMIFSAGCSGGTNGVATTSQPQTQAATQKQIATTAAPTTKAPATQKPTEPVTVKPTEPVTKKQTEAPAEETCPKFLKFSILRLRSRITAAVLILAAPPECLASIISRSFPVLSFVPQTGCTRTQAVLNTIFSRVNISICCL